jgi:hypothetical protein
VVNEVSNEIKGEIQEIKVLVHFEAVTVMVILHVTSCLFHPFFSDRFQNKSTAFLKAKTTA